uniref:RING-CH-type domain-containing protein n=1 Tax=Haptolina brevifila TaxID=156173 RepID=A0A7S2NH20_9EUKA|mmetsp:Transcript_77130/g.153101  ORF Transcript_77130/g.153101 Transcript_77130/m.153101 type:complete len:455 (+) Transcript_77130:57-1421(+)
MGRERGWVAVSVRTYHSHRSSQQQQQRVLQQDYTVDESGATLNAVKSSSDIREEERLAQAGSSSSPTTSIFIRDWKLSGRRAYIRYEREDSCFWFNPVVDDHRPSSSTPGFPCNRGDIFLKLGMRGARLIPWRLREGDVFRLGQAYVLVAKVRASSDERMDVSTLSPYDEEAAAAAAAEEAEMEGDDSADEEGGQRASERTEPKDAPQCYICYEEGHVGNPLINPCQCAGSVKYVHLNCLQRWIQPEGSSAVNTHCPVCKARYPEKTQAMMVRPPAILLESWSNHRTLKLRHWVSFAQHGTASLGRFTDHNDVVIPDHSVSGEHALIVHAKDEFWLHDRESSNGSFIRLCTPLKLQFGESLHLKMGKSLLQLQAKRSRWLRLRMRLNMLRLGGSSEDGVRDPRGSGADRDCLPPVQPGQRTARSFSAEGDAPLAAAEGEGSPSEAALLTDDNVA